MHALGAREALLMVSVAHRAHHLSLHVQIAHGAFGAVQLLVVDSAVVVAILGEKATGCQGLAALDALEARLVEVFISDTQHLA